MARQAFFEHLVINVVGADMRGMRTRRTRSRTGPWGCRLIDLAKSGRLEGVSGLGVKKLEAYGAQVLRMCSGVD
jgi:hypothetical protein